MIEYLTVDLIIAIHDSESSAPVKDYNLLASGAHSPQAGFGDVEAYPTLLEKGAVLLSHLARNHGFHDGNKRCAWLSCKVFLAANGVEINATTQEIIEFVEVRVIINRASVNEIVAWFVEHQA